jgi:endonuclease/exonuclease/phosphatase family metal-dependent hydrolase
MPARAAIPAPDGAARVATFNLLHGMALPSVAGVADPSVAPGDSDGLEAAIHDLSADLVGLQEVDRHQERSGDLDQVAVAAGVMDTPHWRFVPAIHGTPGVEADWSPASAEDGKETEGPTYGVGMASRFPVRRWWVRRFEPAPFSLPLLVPQEPRPRLLRIPDEPRVALAALIDGPAGTFTAVTCHLSFVPGYNWRQLRAIAQWVARMPKPVLLLGDFNLPGALPRLATGWESLAHGATYPSYRPRVQLDHILGLGVGREDVRAEHVLRLGISDHCALAVDVDLDAASARHPQ